MSAWDLAISVLGTLGGLIVGYSISSKIENRKEKHEATIEYRRVLSEHSDDIIKPLYKFIDKAWLDLGVLRKSVLKNDSAEMVSEFLLSARKTQQDLKSFYTLKEAEIDLYLPDPFSSGILILIEENAGKILTQFSKGERPIDELEGVITSLIKYQKNLKKLLGYVTNIEFEEISVDKGITGETPSKR